MKCRPFTGKQLGADVIAIQREQPVLTAEKLRVAVDRAAWRRVPGTLGVAVWLLSPWVLIGRRKDCANLDSSDITSRCRRAVIAVNMNRYFCGRAVVRFETRLKKRNTFSICAAPRRIQNS